ncbi:CinA family protein [Rarobacter faecitabidus]|uniref:Nicotinamide-nucleotide amidase n=1 Tax=Rarobacter faecitabidus TaxID=13243 RepID=A0A542ZWG3_RARFA|nr:nicotinamide-nucleotide amidohydrolase family protein [Rarobacter faecitabidus]TQL64649.1 nicotinamide-nucleotide amidase [Rarobacter faecitabidus]
MPDSRPLAADLVGACSARGISIGTAESLTGGLVAAAIVDIPGASAVLRGGIVAYDLQIKAGVLGVSHDLLAARGAVDPEVAAQMADGAARMLGVRLAISTTGVAGPGSDGGHCAGEVYVGLRLADSDDHVTQRVLRLRLSGDRTQVRAQVVRRALSEALSMVRSGESGE